MYKILTTSSRMRMKIPLAQEAELDMDLTELAAVRRLYRLVMHSATRR